MKTKQLLPYFSIAITVITTILSSAYLLTSGYAVNSEMLFGLGALCILSILIFSKKDYWKHIYTVVLLISWTGLLQFTFVRYTLTFFILIDLIAFSLLFLHLFGNPDTIKFYKSLIPKPYKKFEKDYELDQERITHFMEKFERKTTAELKQIIEENDRVPEAVEAAKKLVKIES